MYCSKCGNEIADDSQFCNLCGTPQRQLESKNGQNKNTDVMNSDITSPLGCFGLLIFIIIAVVFSLNMNFNSSNTTNSNSSQQQVSTQKTQQERQDRLNTINNLINEATNEGLIIKIEKSIYDDKNAYIIVEESMWNQLPHETKQHLCLMANEYSDLTGIKILGFKGYRTGKTIMPFVSSVHNF